MGKNKIHWRLLRPFDIFISYRHTDRFEAERLRNALESRGVRVWLDEDEIRPGDLFAEALERGLASSRAVGLIVTPDSMASQWVKNEYYRALSLSNAGEMQLIPLLFGPTELPGFLKDRSWIDFRQGDYQRNVDRLIWPGITGKHVLFVSFFPIHGFAWRELGDSLSALGCKVAEGEDIDRAFHHIRLYMCEPDTRIVAVVDIFEGWPDNTSRRNAPQEYLEFIFRIRQATKGTSNEIVFLLYHHSAAFEHADHGLLPEELARLAHYFTLHSDLSPYRLSGELRPLWHRIQRELLATECEEVKHEWTF
ncbi:MAG TPA: toll/interleukin-1 receptor domain-containing protein [Candidatus Bathyarchaeia archaeon]|nr:toll/interleukin-1 receptor domain-containing protein [Candidatus Bathyarchaeia archaeon]